MVSKEEDDLRPRRRKRRGVVSEGDQAQLSQDSGVELQRGERNPGRCGKGDQLTGDGGASGLGEVLEDQPLVLVECFR